MASTSSVSLPSLALLVATAMTLCACGGGGGESDASSPSEDQADGAAQTQAASAWAPKVTDTWQWQLSGTINTSYDVKVYDIDLFDAPDSVLATLRSQGKHIVCYFSALPAEK